MAHKPMPMSMEHPSVEEDIRRREENVEWNHHSHTVDQRIRSHDMAGVESAMVDFSEYSDGYGSNVAHGDDSVLRMVEASRYGAINHESYPTPLDTEPWQSKAQAGMMHAHAGEKGYMSKAQVKEYDSKTDFSDLPRHKK